MLDFSGPEYITRYTVRGWLALLILCVDWSWRHSLWLRDWRLLRAYRRDIARSRAHHP